MTDNLFADLSSNNAGFAAKSYVEGGHLFIAIKATEDQHYVNPEYRKWVADAHAHKLGVGHYHFARPENGNPVAQAKHFWATVKPHFRRPGDYTVVDVETGTAAQAHSFTTAFDNQLKKESGTHPVLYTFSSFFNEGNLTISSGRIWLAAWGPNNPGKDWKLARGQTLWAWQFTDGASGPEPHSLKGVSGDCDVSRLNPRTTQQLKAQLRH